MIDQNEKDNKLTISIQIESIAKQGDKLVSQHSNCNDKNLDIATCNKTVNHKKNSDNSDIKLVPTLNNIEQNISSLKKTLTSLDIPDIKTRNSSEKYPLTPNEDNKQLSEYRNLIIKSSDRKENDDVSNRNKEHNDDCATINEGNEKHQAPEIKISLNEYMKKASYVAPMMCFLCDKYLQVNSMFKTANCHHYFCRKCGKLYYEEKIEQGESELKCPMYTCKALLSIELIVLLVSNQHFSGLKGGRNDNNNIALFKKEINDNHELRKLLQKKIEAIKPYSNRHVLDINTNEAFYMFNQTKDQFCPNCYENALFAKSGNHFIKCLNCFHTICKYCFTRYDAFHMDIATADHCKVYYRKKEKNYLDNNKCKFFCIQLLLVIASFLIIFVASFNYFRNWFMALFCIKYSKSKPIGILILVYSISIVFFLCSLPFILMSFPYFPVLIEAIG